MISFGFILVIGLPIFATAATMDDCKTVSMPNTNSEIFCKFIKFLDWSRLGANHQVDKCYRPIFLATGDIQSLRR